MGDLTARRTALLHPVALTALGLLIVNDHVLKAVWPGWWTGKLSDVAALVVAPVALATIAGWFARRGFGIGGADLIARSDRIVAWTSALVVGVAFVAAKLTPIGNAAYAVVAGWFNWPLAVAGAVLAGRPIPSLGPAPTVLDPTDLLALPALVLGAWLALGAPPVRRAFAEFSGESDMSRRALRVAAAGAAWFALAATSPMPPPSILTVTMWDASPIEAGRPSAERSVTVTIGPLQPVDGVVQVDPALSIRIQARPRWPPNDPPARFTLTVGEIGQSAGAAPVVSVPPEACFKSCTLPVTVAVDWPDGAGHGMSTAAWELVATTDVTARGQGPYSGAAPGVSIGGGPARPDPGPNVALVALFLVPLAALWIGGTSVRRRVRSRPRDRVSSGLLAAALAVTAAIVGFGVVVSLVPGTPLGANPWIVTLAGILGIAAFAIGYGAWLRGSGAILIVAIIDGSTLAIPIGGVLTGAGSGVFAERGLVLTVALTGALTVAALLASSRVPPDRGLATDDRLAVLGVGLAVAVAFGLASTDSANGLLYLAVGQLIAIVVWWHGSGWLLGLTSVAGIALVGLAFLIGGPTLFGGVHWTPGDRITQFGILWGSLIGLAAAFRQVGTYPVDASLVEARRATRADEAEPGEPPTH